MDKYLQASHDWKECLWGIARKELEVFEGNNEAYVDNLIYCNCRRHLMVWIYAYLVGCKKAPRIENLDPEVKQQMWGFVKEICAGKTEDKTRMVEISKTFYVIEYFIKESENK